jgi:hypothetical protein
MIDLFAQPASSPRTLAVGVIHSCGKFPGCRGVKPEWALHPYRARNSAITSSAGINSTVPFWISSTRR